MLCLLLALTRLIAWPVTAAPDNVVESGVPAFVVIGPESIGLSSPPNDLHLLGDGRMLVVSEREIAYGDGTRWEVFSHLNADDYISSDIALDATGTIYTGVPGGMAKLQFTDNAHWRLARIADLPAGEGIQQTTMISVAMIDHEWFWYSGSGAIVAWQPDRPARVVGRADCAIEHVFGSARSLFISDQSSGAVLRLDAGRRRAERTTPRTAFAGDTITCSLPLGGGTWLVGTNFEGAQLFDGRNRRPFSPSALLGPGHRINDLCRIGDRGFAAAVDTIGIVFFDSAGRVLQLLDHTADHRLARPRLLVAAPDGVVWALLNDGLVRIRFPSPVSHFELLINSGLSFAKPERHAGALWLLADGKILRSVYDPQGRLDRFTVESPPGRYVFTLDDVDGQLLASSDLGLFTLTPAGWQLAIPGLVNARLCSHRFVDDKLPYVARGEYGEITRTPTGYTATHIPLPGLGDSYGLAEDAAGTVWIELGASRVGRLIQRPHGPELEILGRDHGLIDGWVEISVIDGIARFLQANQHFLYDRRGERFLSDHELLTRYPFLRHARGRPIADPLGRIWYSADDGAYVVEPGLLGRPGTPQRLPVDFVPTNYTTESDGVAWLFARQHLARVDLRIAPPAPPPWGALITSVEFWATGHRVFTPGDALPPIAYSDNSLAFHYVAQSLPFTSHATFEVRLEGADTDWVSTGASGSISFNRLKEGDYIFRVRPVLGASGPGREDRLAFTIRPPWFRTRLAWLLYLLTAAGLVSAVTWFSSYLQRRENDRLERLVTARTAELSRQIAETSEKTLALAASEERYRTLNTELEQRVEQRTAELSRSNRELQHRESLLRLVFEQAPIGISWRRADLGDEIHFNPTYLRILGLPPDAPFDRERLFQMVHPDDVAHQRETSRLMAEGKIDHYHLEERFILPEGRLVWGALSVTVTRDPAGRILQQIGILIDITSRRQAEHELAETYKSLVATSRIAGMAEVATSVLHNIGNVLNSVNVSANILADAVRESKTDLLLKLAALFHEHAHDLGHFLTEDPKGRLVPDLIDKLAQHARQQHDWLTSEIATMQGNIDLIKETVAMQQSYATTAGVTETLAAPSLFEDALRMNATRARPDLKIVRDFAPVPPLCVEKGKVLQILANLISHAHRACAESPAAAGPQITLRLEPGAPGHLRFHVIDNGAGLAPDKLKRIFAHNLSARPDDRTFGLHAAALAAKEMHGSLHATSDGPGRGATFTLELPVAPPSTADRTSALAAFPPTPAARSQISPRSGPPATA